MIEILLVLFGFCMGMAAGLTVADDRRRLPGNIGKELIIRERLIIKGGKYEITL